MRTLLNVLAVSAFALGGTVAAAPVPANAPDGTPIPTGTVWKGKLTQRGGGPEAYDCVFKITKRDGDKFEATLYEKAVGSDEGALELTYLVRGTVTPVDPKNKDKGYKLEFKSFDAKDVKNTSEIVGVPYTGTVTGKSIKGTWKLPDDSEFGKLEGDFEFTAEEKKDEKKKDCGRAGGEPRGLSPW
jgi:hypothetical protein